MLTGASARRLELTGAALILVAWTSIHLYFGSQIIYHDSWKHIFPFLFNIVKQSECGALPSWLGMVDNGSPTIIYVVSFSLTQIIRLPWLYLAGCLHPDVVTGAYLYKAQIYLTYLCFGAGMCCLGRVIYNNKFASIYLLGATLFAGMCLDSAHSSQVVAELFWVPWLVAAAALYHRNRNTAAAARYLNFAVLFFCLQLLDHYPHLIVLSAAVGLLLYVTLADKLSLKLDFRQLMRLWPAALLLIVTMVHMHILKQHIGDYSPSLRSDLVVDPGKFGVTGFVQPTALISSFLPLGFLAGYDAVAATKPWFIFRLDTLIFYFGMLPLMLALVFVVQEGNRRLRLGWSLFALAIFMVSLQQSKLYFLLFRLPFFDLFRGYFLFIVYVAFAILVMSGYGMDFLLSANRDDRKRAFKRVIVVAGLLTLASLGVLGWLVAITPGREQLAQIMKWLAIDVLLAGAAFAAIAYCMYSKSAWKPAAAALAVTVASQCIYVAGVYNLTGTPMLKMFADYGLDEKDLSAAPLEARRVPVHSQRKLCTEFGQCYLSMRPTVSLNLDLEGTFLRNRGEPVFQRGLTRSAQEALTGLTRADVWLSRSMVPVAGESEILSALNAAANVNSLLDEKTFTRSGEVRQLSPGARSNGQIIQVVRHPDRVAVSYRSEEPQILNLAINFDRAWRASIGGGLLPVVHANFGGIAVAVPRGEAKVTFEYRNTRSDFFFLSRYLLLLMAIVAVIVLIRRLHD